jgi:hypothetical protein
MQKCNAENAIKIMFAFLVLYYSPFPEHLILIPVLLVGESRSEATHNERNLCRPVIRACRAVLVVMFVGLFLSHFRAKKVRN